MDIEQAKSFKPSYKHYQTDGTDLTTYKLSFSNVPTYPSIKYENL